MRFVLISISLILINISQLVCQNIEKFGKKDMLKVSGGLNYSSVFYNADGITNRRQPFTWFLNGNITVNVLDVSLPFTFNYSNNQVAYTQPFNIQSFNPTYKWIKGYAGITTMNFSQYTMAGHVFAGGGVELTPKNFKFSAMYGRLKKAVEYDAAGNSELNMSYKRMGWGALFGYEKNGHGIKLIYFGAKDDATSLSFMPINTNITPMENSVISLMGNTIILKKIKLEAEYALSGLTRNSTSPPDLNSIPPNKLPLIFNPNATSQFFSAIRSSIGYNFKSFGLNFNYERIDPDYKTLGAYYFNNDLENFTIAPSVGLLHGKLSISLNTGLQRNNIDESKLNTTKRWVGSINLNYLPNKKWNLSASYSNFSTYTKQRPQEDPFFKNTLDTLNFYQLSQNAFLSMGYNFATSITKQNTLFSVNYLISGQNQGSINDPGLFGNTSNIDVPSTVINGNLSHSLSFIKTKTSITLSVNANKSEMLGNNSFYFGPNINLSQALFNNSVRVTIGSSYNQLLSNSIKTNEVFNHRLSFSYSPKFKNQKTGRIALISSIIYLQKTKSTSGANAFNEFTGNVGANYSF